MGTWENKKWGDIATLEYGKSLKNYEFSTEKYRVYGTNGPIGWHSVPLCQHPGVIIGRKGAYRGIHYSPKPFFVIDTAFYLEPKENIDIKWAYYELLTQDINGMDSGSAIPSTSRDSFYLLPVKVPPPSEQRAISSILGALDDKIELNRKMNETLEAMARAIYKSWFVDFEPVRAKAEGKKPFGMDDETAALFSDSFEESKMGRIPKGWRAGSFGDIAENLRRIVQPGKVSPDAPYIGLEHIPKKCIILDSWGVAEDITSTKSEFNKGEVLFGKLRPYFHKVGLAQIDGICSTDILVIAPKKTSFLSYVLFTAFREDFVGHADSCSTGTKMPRANWNDLAKFEIPIFPDKTAEAFNRIIYPMLNKSHCNVHESFVLKSVRDFLLPRLLSGQIHIQEAMGLVK